MKYLETAWRLYDPYGAPFYPQKKTKGEAIAMWDADHDTKWEDAAKRGYTVRRVTVEWED